ncbi:3-deoxy-D-manno-octulosonic-acid transferase [Roseateles sp. YR242]|uniref:3-deoxy-D-manno-octulosonic acid transferase n=1 Tax=Roseateles sp. YR242 TaxID=1855305 RepID=UPI0008AE7C6D|nr:glycosyltransferase N-terminal domain-containing protein [Roseateles sp. YR242]SEL62690.1 3-deoxy-D-manno-octulosonic-acid transferase [Roseateles sp. YR242]
MREALPHRRRSVAPGEALRWTLFRALERLSDWRGNNTQGVFTLSDPQARGPALWLYITTIGELNAVAPMLEWLVAQRPDLRPVLITEHAHYQEAYLARLPGAVVCLTRGHSLDARRLAAQLPPQVLALAEIPCLPSDAPCRFSYAFLREARHHGAATLLLNGWLYHYAPPARLDQVERRLLERDYLQALDVLCVQDDETAATLAARGAPGERLHVTGNMKFDAMQRPHWQVSQARSPLLLGALISGQRPTVVGGCVTELLEQQAVLGAFQRLRAHHPQALLILAPRHPENQERLQALLAQVEAQGLCWVRRSAVPDAPLPPDVHCLVLDTVGELRDFYAAASVAHVGVDHNVLEPLGLGKALTIQDGWNTTYPSYPVYRLLRDQGVLHTCTDEAALCEYWRAAIDHAPAITEDLRRTEEVLAAMRGSVIRHQQACAPWLAHKLANRG